MDNGPLTYPPGTRVVPINLAYGYLESSKLCAGTVLKSVGDAGSGFDTLEVAWDDGDIELESVSDVVHIGITTDDETFGKFAECVTIFNHALGNVN